MIQFFRNLAAIYQVLLREAEKHRREEEDRIRKENRHRLRLCTKHRQEQSRSDYAPQNCDYCKLEAKYTKLLRDGKPS